MIIYNHVSQLCTCYMKHFNVGVYCGMPLWYTLDLPWTYPGYTLAGALEPLPNPFVKYTDCLPISHVVFINHYKWPRINWYPLNCLDTPWMRPGLYLCYACILFSHRIKTILPPRAHQCFIQLYTIYIPQSLVNNNTLSLKTNSHNTLNNKRSENGIILSV